MSMTESRAGSGIVKLGDSQIWYHRAGNGPALLHIHGSAFGHRNFERLTPFMRSEFEVIDFDLPGYGESRSSRDLSTVEKLADLVAEFIPNLGCKSIDIHGTSFGALVAVALATRHPHLVSRLVLSCFVARYDAAARVMRNTWKQAARYSGMAAVADLTAVAGFARAYFERDEAPAQLASMREAFSRNTPEGFIGAVEALERLDFSELVGQITCPVLLISADEDNMTPYNTGASGFGMSRVREKLPHAEYEHILECGHYLVLEQPERVFRRITGFLKGSANGK